MTVHKMREFCVAFEDLCRQFGVAYTIQYSTDRMCVETTFKAKGGRNNEEIAHKALTFDKLVPEPASQPVKKRGRPKIKRVK